MTTNTSMLGYLPTIEKGGVGEKKMNKNTQKTKKLLYRLKSPKVQVTLLEGVVV